MKISLNWIKDFVDLTGVTVEDIDKKFNEMCAEIEEIEVKGADTCGVVYGKILEVKNHPESNHLHILKVDVGREVLQIVCGAPNVREGMITCVATVGGKVCGHKINPAKLVGVESFGMCCSEAELGIGSNDDGICDVDYPVTLGQDIKEVLPIDDIVIEIDNKTLTNRPDLWGHYGLAREFSAIFNRELKPLKTVDLSKFEGLKPVSVKVECDDCLRYSAISVENVTQKVSPATMKIRLNYAGMRDINLLADITNYIMLELGQPMHAFDNRKVEAIKVRSAVEGDKLLTLEGEEHAIPQGAIVICDGKNVPVAIAGIKGGLKASISDQTDSVLFESATFESSAIRKTSRGIGLITDASIRYEKSLDPELTPVALARILQVLKEVDGGIVVTSSMGDFYNKKYPTVKLSITSEFVSKRIGMEISANEIADILTKLGFVCKINGSNIDCVVPSNRATKDISIKEDLVEEVARMKRYGTIEQKPLVLSVEPVNQPAEHELEFKAKKLLASKYGASEVHSYIWDYAGFNAEHKIKTSPCLRLVDSRNAGQSAIRPQMLPTLLKIASENKEAEGGEVKIFEIGRCVPSLNADGLANEEKHLAVVFMGHASDEVLFNDLKNYLYDFAKNYVGATLSFVRKGEYPNYMHAVNTASVEFNGKSLGHIGVISPIVAKTIDKKLNMVGCEIDFSALCACHDYPKKVKVPSKQQSVNLDLNFLVDKTKTYAEVAGVLSKIRSKLMVGFKLVEIFESEQLEGKKSMLFSFEINGRDHTLSGEEIDTFMNDVIVLMAKNNCPLR